MIRVAALVAEHHTERAVEWRHGVPIKLMAVDSLLIKAPTAAGEVLAEANQEDRVPAALAPKYNYGIGVVAMGRA